ncbi:MAG: LPS assembly lipoprotein LptE [Roseibacillus sp.]|jgi:hypothetical protein|nr:hypothetical protein [Roseibacillus sp.]MDP7306101.1 LPS assembly lipoprotein LptE [Roseibacillus sp.]HJM63284.1 LPS assembly lipoprotein LptE [Roseibacillus sp.]|tara:strand:+ start:8381 stop:8932 length:552 start_codon:yes stop_codon:yes gene_type:complete
MMFDQQRSDSRVSLLLGLVAATAISLSCSNCAGYKWGDAKPKHLSTVHNLNVAMVENDTQIPRAAALATNCLIDAITRDGTYRVSRIDTADACLLTTLKKIEHRQARSTREDILRSEELEMAAHLNWSLVDARNPTKVLASGTSRGSTRFFVDPNLQTANQTALGDAIKRAAEGVIAGVSEGF